MSPNSCAHFLVQERLCETRVNKLQSTSQIHGKSFEPPFYWLKITKRKKEYLMACEN